MNGPFRNSRIWNNMKSWLIFIVVLLVLRYTGVLAGISVITGRALMHTGVMDASTDGPPVLRKFDYNFMLRTLDGRVVKAENFRGKTIFLNIWATWCGPCRMEMPSIQKLYNQTDTTKVVFIMLSVDRPGDLEKVKSFVKEKEYTFPVYTPGGTLTGQLDVGEIPTTLVIGPDGKIVSNESGAANYDTPKFKKFLDSLTIQ